MNKIQTKDLRKAQGMVEFALALPILLLLILGIFAFGHMIFTYSSVVSASREAARYGTANGETDDGALRYQDCDGILAAAERVGGVAGVTAGDIQITYDKGPDTDTIGECMPGEIGPVVDLGDRVNVTVNVNYRPIVPMLNIPEIALHAATARTIVKSVSVGQAPDANMPFLTTEMTFTQNINPSIVGQIVTFTVSLTAHDAKGVPADPPTNADSITITDSDGNSICTLSAPGGSCSHTYCTTGLRTVTANYAGNYENPLYEPVEAELDHQVNAAPASVSIQSHNPDPSINGAQVLVSVHVSGIAAQCDAPSGSVLVTSPMSPWGCPANVNASGDGSCYITLIGTGWTDIRADYSGDDNYDAANKWASVKHRVENGATATPQPTPTMVVPPTITPIPAYCPTVVTATNFAAQQNGFTLSIKNNDASHSILLRSANLSWPETGTPKLQEVHFAPSTVTGCSGKTNDCVWNSGGGISPPNATASYSDTNNWNTANEGMTASQTKEMRMVFNHNLANGAYALILQFSNGCTLTVNTSRLQ
jgi:Flp pilus assembly protein TadG